MIGSPHPTVKSTALLRSVKNTGGAVHSSQANRDLGGTREIAPHLKQRKRPVEKKRWVRSAFHSTRHKFIKENNQSRQLPPPSGNSAPPQTLRLTHSAPAKRSVVPLLLRCHPWPRSSHSRTRSPLCTASSVHSSNPGHTPARTKSSPLEGILFGVRPYKARFFFQL